MYKCFMMASVDITRPARDNNAATSNIEKLICRDYIVVVLVDGITGLNRAGLMIGRVLFALSIIAQYIGWSSALMGEGR